MQVKIAIFASGSGTNAENIIKHFQDNKDIEVSLVLANNPNAFVLERAKKLSVPSFVFNKDDFYSSDKVLDILQRNNIDFLVLAGFLWLIPSSLIKAFSNRIINIHPALLPKYGGKGMFGDNVHKSVIAHNEQESGITIHYVNERYDEGETIFQAKCTVERNDTAESLANKIHALEYKYFPEVIEQVVKLK